MIFPGKAAKPSVDWSKFESRLQEFSRPPSSERTVPLRFDLSPASTDLPLIASAPLANDPAELARPILTQLDRPGDAAPNPLQGMLQLLAAGSPSNPQSVA